MYKIRSQFLCKNVPLLMVKSFSACTSLYTYLTLVSSAEATISLLQCKVKAISSGDCWQSASRNKLATAPEEHQYMQPAHFIHLIYEIFYISYIYNLPAKTMESERDAFYHLHFHINHRTPI